MFALRPLVKMLLVPSPGPGTPVFDVAIKDGKMIPSEITVSQGDRVTLNITTNYVVDLKLYNIQREIYPGKTTRVFRVEQAGQYEITDARTNTKLGMLVVNPNPKE